MADCKEIDAALAKLSSKIDGLNGRLNDLESKQRECCDKKINNNSDTSLEALIRRIVKLETTANELLEAIKVISQFIVDGLRPLLKIINSFPTF